jgi:hypothetical protein
MVVCGEVSRQNIGILKQNNLVPLTKEFSEGQKLLLWFTHCQQIICKKCWTTPEEVDELNYDILTLIGKLSRPATYCGFYGSVYLLHHESFVARTRKGHYSVSCE